MLQGNLRWRIFLTNLTVVLILIKQKMQEMVFLALHELANGTHWFTRDLAQAKNPLIIVGPEKALCKWKLWKKCTESSFND